MTCKSTGRRSPRVLPGRHNEECEGDPCPGCLACPEPHCRVCERTHAPQTCAECLATTRAYLHDIGRMCGELPAEVEHRGINGEAMMLLGPAADPEQRGHLEASVKAGRVPADYLEHADHESHPLFVLGTWDMVWRDALDHHEPDTLRLSTTIDYLDRNMTYMAGYEHTDFGKFASDVRSCATHLRAVLHDQDQGDRAGVGCFDCGADLERRLTATGFEDHWTCQRCRRKYTVAEYNFALRAKLEEAG